MLGNSSPGFPFRTTIVDKFTIRDDCDHLAITPVRSSKTSPIRHLEAALISKPNLSLYSCNWYMWFLQ